jgi:SAM-dependent methyltransferase
LALASDPFDDRAPSVDERLRLVSQIRDGIAEEANANAEVLDRTGARLRDAATRGSVHLVSPVIPEPHPVAALYDAAPEREWARLDQRRIEFGVTLRALHEFLPAPPARVIDIGSGPGRYAIPLAAQGYAVSLLDVSSACLTLAEHEAQRAGVSFGRVVHGTATALDAFPDASFDAALLFGPLYHLQHESDRELAVSEALRVLRHFPRPFDIYGAAQAAPDVFDAETILNWADRQYDRATDK